MTGRRHNIWIDIKLLWHISATPQAMVEIAGMYRLLSPLIVEIRQFKNQKLSQTTKICLIVSENKLYAIKNEKQILLD